jgi:hypothetical protein
MIRDYKKGIIPLLNIQLGNSNSNRIKEWYTMLNKKHPIFGKYASGTMGLALIDLNKFNSFADYENSVRGKDYVTVKCSRCINRGYTFNVLNRNKYHEEIFLINTSADMRQGKKMKKQYLKADKSYEQEELTEYYGVFNKEGKLVSYIHLLFTEETVFIFKLLGHDDYLKDNIMYLMIFKAIEQIFNRKKEKTYQNLKYIIYDSFFTNSEGLVFFKKRFGFSPYAVKWLID